MKKVLITGAGGFVGRNLSRFLTETGQYQVEAITRDIGGLQGRDLFHAAWTYDQLTALLWDDYDAIIHLAGLAHDTSAKLYRQEDYKNVNLELTKSVFDEFCKHKTPLFIYMSTSKVYDDGLQIISETSPANPKDFYSSFKLDAERYIQDKMTSGGHGKLYYILRPSMIHGPHNKGNLNALFAFVSRGIPYPLASFHNRRSYLCADNLSFVIDRIVQQKPLSGVYNIADDDDISTTELVKIISEEAGRKFFPLRIPSSLIRIVFRIGDKVGASINAATLNKLIGTRVIKNDKIKVALGIEKFPLSLREGLRKTIRSFSQTAA